MQTACVSTEESPKPSVAVPQETSPAESNPSPSVFGVPLAAFVRGGTTSAAHDKLMAQQRAEDEQRRNEADEEKRLAATEQGAHLYNYNMGTPQQHPVVKLTLVSASGDVKFDKSKPIEILADVYSGDNPDDPNDLTLNMACPYCWSRGTPLGRCQFKVRQSNRFWGLDVRGQGEVVAFEGQVHRNAGTIMDSEKIRCPQCAWTFRIDRNRIYEEMAG